MKIDTQQLIEDLFLVLSTVASAIRAHKANQPQTEPTQTTTTPNQG
jgi:hypothetical protein